MLSSINDFSDRISPVLVKELRQGMRAKLFVGLFLGLQIFLGVMLFSAVSAATGNNPGGVISGMIFTFFSIILLVFQPLRGINALHGEIKDGTIDMMVLTRLNAWRIVFGKWISVAGQSTLFFTTIIPYLILRYFFGGMNLFAELVALVLIFLLSLTLTAGTIGLSACTNVFIRGLLPILAIPALYVGAVIASFSSLGGRSPYTWFTFSSGESWIVLGVLFTAFFHVGYSMLSLGTSLIAPAAENHAIVRRIIALLLMAAAGTAAVFFPAYEEGAHITVMLLIAVPAIVIGLTEAAPIIMAAHRPFQKFGPPGRFAGLFLTNSWSSGVIFSIVMFCAAVASILAHDAIRMDSESVTVLMACLGALFFPAVWQALFFRGEGQRLTHYLLILSASGLIWVVLISLSEAMDSDKFLWAFAWHPLAYQCMVVSNPPNESLVLTSLILLLVIYFFILSIKALRGFTLHKRQQDTPPHGLED
ncbi:MAG: hypothetical protein V4733_00920 [Verrucomicrobiota bacterium]